MEKVRVEIEADGTKAKKEINDVNDAVNDVKDSTKGIKKGLNDGTKGAKGLAGGFKKVGTAIKAAGIGILLGLLATLRELFMSNQKTVDFFSTSMNFLKIAFSDFVDFLSNNIGGITGFFKDIFENPRENLIAFGNAIKDNLIERFNSFLDTLGYIASAVKKVFSGDFRGALQDVKNAGKESIDVLTGVNNSADKIAEGTKKVVGAVSEYTKKTYESAKAITEQTKAGELAGAQLAGLIEKYDLMAETQRQIRDDERLSLEERKQANEELGRILEEQQAMMMAQAREQVKAKELQLALDKDNVEFQRELIEAKNELIGVEAQVNGMKSEQKAQTMTLAREEADLIELKKRGELEVTQIEKNGLEEREMNEMRKLQASLDRIDAEKQAELDLLTEKQSIFAEESIAYQELEAEKNRISAEAKQRQLTLEQQLEQQKMAVTMEAIGSLKSVLGENTKAGKALGIAEAIINTYVGATQALKNPYPFNLIAVASTLASGFASIRAITAVDETGESTGGVSTPTSGGAPSIGPNVAIAGGGTNSDSQLLGSIADAVSQPSRSYVVSTDVTTQQSLDRSIQQNATFP